MVEEHDQLDDMFIDSERVIFVWSWEEQIHLNSAQFEKFFSRY